MVTKLSEIEINPKSPFRNDALCRREQVDILTKLIASAKQPFVLSIEAPWGFGKTTFIKLCKAHLESQNHICLYFNAWENDFVDDPLVAFLGEMNKCVEAVCEESSDKSVWDIWENVKRIGGGVLRKTLPLAIQIATHGLLNKEYANKLPEALADNAEKIGDFASELAKERLEKYHQEKNGIASFRESLEKLAEKITNKTGKNQPLIFFVDELDRCRPDFAIVLLERIKHLFNVNNVVFVLAIDRAQLNQSVKALYGISAKPDGYLRRFIDLAYQLPVPSDDAFARNLFNRFSFVDIGGWYGLDELLFRSFTVFSGSFGLSLRTQEQCFTEMNIVLRTNPKLREYPAELSFLTTLKAYDRDIISGLKENRVQIETVMTMLAKADVKCAKHAEAALLTAFPEGSEATKRLTEYKRLLTPGLVYEDAGRQRHAKEITGIIRNLQNRVPNVPEHVLSLLSLSEAFR